MELINGGKMAIKYILFDFDGTLVDSNEAVISSLNHVAIDYRGYSFQPHELEEILGKPIVDQMSFLSVDESPRLVDLYRVEYRRVQDAMTSIYEGMVELLRALKDRGILTAVVSNKGRNGINHGIEKFNLHDLIDTAISLDDVANPKPHQEGVLMALTKLGVPQEFIQNALEMCLFVGDSGHDLETAKNAGCKSVLVGWTLLNRDKLMKLKPDYIIESPKELLKVIDQIELVEVKNG